MAPRKNIVKSGNAGSSSKSQKSDVQTTNAVAASSSLNVNATPSLFPPGSKTPLALLYERYGLSRFLWISEKSKPDRHLWFSGTRSMPATIQTECIQFIDLFFAFRCQKNGWEKPDIQTVRILCKANSKFRKTEDILIYIIDFDSFVMEKALQG
jgi:hypothetical protein